MKLFFIISFILNCELCFTQQRVFVYDSNDAIYELNLNNCSSRFICKSDSAGFTDIAITSDGRFWGIGTKLNPDHTGMTGVFFVDTTSGLCTFINGTQNFESASLAALNDSILLLDGGDSLYELNVNNGYTFTVGNIGNQSFGDLCWLGNDLYMTSADNLRNGLLIKIVLNNNYTSVISAIPQNKFIPLCSGIATASFNGSDSLVGLQIQVHTYFHWWMKCPIFTVLHLIQDIF